MGEGDHRHQVAAKDFIGQDAAVLAKAAGRNVPPQTELLFGETDESNPFVPVEQMMPFVPFVRVRDVDEAIAKAKYYEHGFRHTSIIHSNNVRNMTKMGPHWTPRCSSKTALAWPRSGSAAKGISRFRLPRRRAKESRRR